MLSPNSKLPLANCKVLKQYNEDSRCNVIRIALLIWAFLRLAVSVLWTGLIILAIAGQLLSPYAREPPSRLVFGTFAVQIQLIEIAMLVTFIVAGLKKSASLYRAYYCYCILSLIIYVVSVTMCLSLGYDKGHYFGELYLFYHYFDVAGINGNDELLFFIASIVDVGLEILLICLIKKLINNYRHHDNIHVAEETA